jgi:hypothetical protein
MKAKSTSMPECIDSCLRKAPVSLSLILVLTFANGVGAQNSQSFPPEVQSLVAVYSNGEITTSQLRTLCQNGEKNPQGPFTYTVIFRQMKSLCNGYLAGVSDVAIHANPSGLDNSDGGGTSAKLRCHGSVSDSTHLSARFLEISGKKSVSAQKSAVDFVMRNLLICEK